MAPKKPGKCWDGSASGMKWPHTRRSRSRNCSCSGAGREQSEVFGDFFDEGFQEGGLDEPYFLQAQFFLDGGHDDGGPNLVINEVRVGVTDQNNVALLHAITSSIFPTGLRARLPKLC